MRSSINHYNSCKRIALKAIIDSDKNTDLQFNSPTIDIIIGLCNLGLIPEMVRPTSHFAKKALYAFGEGKEPIESTKKKKRKATHKKPPSAPIKNHSKPKRKRKNKKATAYKTKSAKFLTSWEWRTLRYEVLLEHGRRCMCCGATPDDGRTVIHVDHIKPRHKYPELSLVRDNLQILCGVCNQGKGAWDETDFRDCEEDENERLEREFQMGLADKATTFQ